MSQSPVSAIPSSCRWTRGIMVAPFLLVLALAGCGAPPRLTMRALVPVNTDAAGESLPVKVRIYALRDDVRFRTAEAAELWVRDREVLGDDRLLDPKVVILPPGLPPYAPQSVELADLPKGTRFLGILALIQRADTPDRRRAVLALSDAESQIIDVLDATIVLHEDINVIPEHPRKGGAVALPATASDAPPPPDPQWLP